jgi:LmbE family N-acetylglucosaminyl deacetylase
MYRFFVLFALGAGLMIGQTGKLRIIAIGAHPDDCDIRIGGTAIKFAKMGHAVKFVSMTNGDAGHQSEGGGALARRRRAEAQEAGRRFGIAEYETLDNHDGELLPTLAIRQQLIRKIRQWKADVVFSPRSNDYHPDHRYTGMLVQDAAYMVVVPNVCPDTPPLENNPVFFYFEDQFQKPQPFRPDIAVDIDDVWSQKVNALDAHVSQFYEWLPWVDHRLTEVPKSAAERKQWLGQQRDGSITPEIRAALEKYYGSGQAAKVQHAEAFELCEYGRQPKGEDLKKLFPMLK